MSEAPEASSTLAQAAPITAPAIEPEVGESPNIECLGRASADFECKADTWNDNDSAFEGSIEGSSTTSIGSSILDYRKENGRRYHAYKEGSASLSLVLLFFNHCICF
jgi:hypothetical protein